jgi:hypothetical protein
LAGPQARARWMAQAVESGALRPTHAIPAGAVALQVSHRMPRSFVTTSASLMARELIPRQLAQSRERVLLSAEKALMSGRSTSLTTEMIPASLLSAPSSQVVPLAPASWRPGWATYQTDQAATSLLVEMDAFMPGWRVFVDGKEQPILQADVFGRAVVVPAGHRTVTWSFAPPLLVACLLTTWTSLGLCLLALLLRRRFGWEQVSANTTETQPQSRTDNLPS